MKRLNEKFYLTTPIFYVNDRPHLGHAYTVISADILARYHRQKRERVFFLTGTDEHGKKIEQVAEKFNKTPAQLCDENSEKFKQSWKILNISYDNFIRTTNADHIFAVQRALQFLYDKKFIYKGIYEGLYCSGCEQYKKKSDLVDGKCPDHKTKPELIKEESYLFKLSQFQDILTEKIKNDELEIKPESRKKEVLEFLKEGLEDISISRQRVRWGIPLPFDKSHTCYVWIDAFLNYLTGLGWEGDPKKISDFWPPDLQLMAKDIIRVHATIWPALLLALGVPLPKKIFVHGYFTINGQKMSKSLGNVIWPDELVEKFGVDATRYLLISACNFGEDGDISWEKLTKKYNSDLASGLGNLVARVLKMAENLHIQIAELPSCLSNSKLKKEVDNNWVKYRNLLDELKINEALNSIWNLISFCDSIIEKERPWSFNSSKEEKKSKEIIGDLLLTLKEVANLLEPFLPETSNKILEQVKDNKGEILFPRLK